MKHHSISALRFAGHFLCGAIALTLGLSTSSAYVTKGGCVTLEEKDWNAEDNTTLLQELLENPSFDEIVIPAAPGGGTWKVAPLHVKRDKQTIHLLKGAVLEAKPRAYDLPAGTQSVLTAQNLADLRFLGEEGAGIQMQKEDYAKLPVAEWRHALNVSGCSNVTIEGLRFANTGGDGIYIGAGERGYCSNIVVRKVVTDGAGRNGLSIISVDGMLVEESTFKNTSGLGNVAPKGPFAGIDVEPNKPGERIKDLVIRGCKFVGNDRYGFLQATTFMRGSTGSMDITVTDCDFSRNKEYGIIIKEVPGTLDSTTKTLFKNCRINNHPKAAIGVLGKAQAAGVVVFEDCALVNNRTAGPGDLIEINKFGLGRKDEPIGNILFNNLILD